MYMIINRRVYEWESIKGTPSFRRFPDLKDDATDRVEIFTTDRTPKMIRHVFEEKFFLGFF